ncbi:FprA family A-type flavoprotein [Candidatus Bathyarchaeota archaeon]|nr:FprA family A-type flavoprotein [Candidatus Bathyarchaeota archaeon]
MAKVALTEGLFWVGAIDWNIRSFHGYHTPYGTTYNAYLIIDEKIALVDTVKGPFFSEMLQRIEEIVEPKEIDYVISNHVETDHSGSLPKIMEIAKKAKLIASERGKPGLLKHYKIDWPFVTVKQINNELSLGKRKLKFIETPMLHWPDSMATHVETDGILLPNDAFGQHIATSERFDDEVGLEVIMPEAAKYYANIVMPFGAIVQGVLEKLKDLKINMIGPSHGIVWRTHIKEIFNAYWKWARGEAENKVLVIYDTMWGSTEMIAKALVEGLSNEGVKVILFNLSSSDKTEIIKETLDAKALLIGSPTLNGGMFPTVASFLTYLKGLKPKGKIGACFGSYGWGGGAVKAINEELRQAGVEVLEAALDFKFVPEKEDLAKAVEFGKMIAKKVKQ